MDHTHYDNLQVARNASDEVIKGAYKYLSQKWHPDRQPPEKQAEALRVMKLINTAYTVLIDPVARQKHDEWIREQEEAEERTKATGDPATDSGASQTPGGTKSQLSDDVRHHFVESLASAAWPLLTFQALIGTLFWLFCLFLIANWLGFLPALDRFIEKFAWVYAVVFGWLMWVGFGLAKKEKRKSLYKLSDELLAIKFQETKSRNKVLIAAGIAVLVGGMITFAVLNRTEPSSNAAAEAPAPAAPAAPTTTATPAPRPAAAPVASVQKMRVINECHKPAEVLFAREAPSQFMIAKKSVMAQSDEVYVLGEPLVDKHNAEAYWAARSIDRTIEWVEKNELQGAAFAIEDKAMRFFEASDRDAQGTYLVKILCEKPKLELIN